MSKRLKMAVSVILVCGIISSVTLGTNESLLTTKAYASTTATNDTDKLDSLKLETSSGSTIKLYSDNDYASSNKVDSSSVSSGDTYYAKSSSNTIKISTNGPNSKYVRVFKGTSSSAKGKKTSSDISLSSGTNTLIVRVYGSDPGTSIMYDEDTDVVSEYTIKVKCTASDSSSSDSTSSDSSDSSSSYDDIYLSKLTVSDGDLSFSKDTSSYDINVGNDVSDITIKAVPEDSNYTVTIDGTTVDDSDNYKKTVSINKGSNKVLVKIEDDSSNHRAYTLNITRSSNSSNNTNTNGASTAANTNIATTTPNTATEIISKAAKANQWVRVNGAWQYNDSTGKPVKNTWYFDRGYGNYYYLQDNGSMATGWLSNNGKWYYLGTDGAMKTGWQLVSGAWYYLDSQGVMAYNTTIGGYKLGANGAWIN